MTTTEQLIKEWDEALAMDKERTAQATAPASYHVSENGMKIYHKGGCILTIPVGQYLGLIEDLAIKLNNVASEMPKPEPVMSWQQQQVIDDLTALANQAGDSKTLNGGWVEAVADSIIKIAEKE